MIKNLLTPEKDPMGMAIADYHRTGKAGRLRVLSSLFDEDEIPVWHLFRSYEEFPVLERTAVDMAQGRILDVGAGSGCHSLALQEKGMDVTAIDISPLSVDIMKERGVETVRQVNLFDPALQDSFDTILMLMNGSGVIGRLSNLPVFFDVMKRLLSPKGCVLMDSSDLSYLLEDEEPLDDYIGEVDFRMKYKQINGEPFDWLYLDFDTLRTAAVNYGFKAELVQEGEHYDYLAQLSFSNGY